MDLESFFTDFDGSWGHTGLRDDPFRTNGRADRSDRCKSFQYSGADSDDLLRPWDRRRDVTLWTERDGRRCCHVGGRPPDRLRERRGRLFRRIDSATAIISILRQSSNALI